MAGTKSLFEQNIERSMGESIESIREVPLAERRKMNEAKAGKRMSVIRYHPIIGRGNVLGDRGVTHKDAEKAYKKAIRVPWHEYARRFCIWWRR